MKKPTKEQLEFCQQHNLSFDEFKGKSKIDGDLNLNSVTSISVGFNPNVVGSFSMNWVTKLVEGFNPTVGGNFRMNSVTKIIKGFNPTVGGSLFLNSVTSLPEGFSPTVGGGLDLESVVTIPVNFNPTVGGSLFLDSVTNLPVGFNPTVGGDLDLRSVRELPVNFNPTVGGGLFLNSVTILPVNFNPTVGVSLFLHSVKDKSTINYTKLEGDFIDFGNGFIKCDGIFMEVTSKRGKVWRGHKVASSEEIVLVTDGNGRYSHGETLKEAKEDLLFKLDGRRPDDFKHLTKETVLSLEEGVFAYRVITGACGFGVKDYLKNRLPKKKKQFSVKEITELTASEYGGRKFAEFIG